MDKTKIDRRVLRYFGWPLYLSVFLLVMNLCVYFVDKEAGVVITIFLVAYLAFALGLYFTRKKAIRNILVEYATNYAQVQRQFIKELVLPYAVLDDTGCVLWANDEFMNIVEKTSITNKPIFRMLPDISIESLPEDGMDFEQHIRCKDRDYKVTIRRIYMEQFGNEKKYAGVDDNTLITVYMQDETEIKEYMQQIEEQRLIVGLLYIDNYDEVLDDADEVRASLLTALIDRKVNKYMQGMDAIIKKIEKDKYVFLFKHKYLQVFEHSKFSLLDEVRGINIGNEMAATISIGLGINEESYLKSYEYARVAIDLALGRGGDQAVIKKGERIAYYGGSSVQVEKKTRVKARVKAHALKELMETRDRVIIMGHSIGDVDSFGASVGVYRIAKTMGKKANVVINEITTSVRPMMKRFQSDADYEEDMFLNSEQALQIVDLNTLLVIVDVNRASYTECPELIEKAKTVVVLDHHRQVGEVVENAVLSYIEPYASSACEMVAEILQYVGDDLKLRQVEADAMYAGIMIDTNNFLTKTGVRTFEAAAFLRRCGADITKVRKLFRINKLEYKARAEAVHDMEIFMEHFAITECKAEGIDSPTVLGAQVANELLNIAEIKASFVLTEHNQKIYISARSIDEVNVQLVMEKLGGGGHLSVAGAQIADVDMLRAKQMVRDVLFHMYENGEL